LTKKEIIEAMTVWNQAWDRHDLDGVMALFHEQVIFVNWTGGRVQGRAALRQAWEPWFANHGGFKFTPQDLFVDEAEQKVAYQWRLDWPCPEKGYAGQPERRFGMDIIHFRDGKIIGKFSYSQTTLEVAGQRLRLTP
jgi:ketosteroid isomerase-like protein